MGAHRIRAAAAVVAMTVGGIAVTAGMAAAQPNCSTASPSNVNCGPEVSVPKEVGRGSTKKATPANPTPVEELAFTGSDTVELVAVGGVLATAGTVATLLSRRRRTR